jgi:hypothetical protein
LCTRVPIKAPNNTHTLLKVVLKVTLCLGPSLTLFSLIHPQFEYIAIRVSKIGYGLDRYPQSQDLQDFILTRLDSMNEEKL